MPHEHRLTVRYAETDQMGVVHHASYLVYLEEARTAYMASVGASYGALERTGVGLAVRRAELRYRAPARYEDVLVVRTRVERLGAASVTFAYELEREGEPVASARTELACIDLESDRRPPRALPEALRAVLTPLVARP